MRRVTVKSLVELASGVFGLSAAAILSHRRDGKLVRARHAVFRIARDFSGLSYPEIARHMGGRDHTTVLYGAAQCVERMRRDPLYAARVRRLRKLAKRSACRRRARPAPRRPRVIDWDLFARQIKLGLERPALREAAEPPGKWWERSDEDLLSEAVRAHYAAGGDCLEVWG